MERLWISRFAVKNFGSIVACDVELGPLTFFVGPNGSGKSTLLNALHFLSRAIGQSPKQELVSRGGLLNMLHKPVSFPSTFSFELEVAATFGVMGSFEVVFTTTIDEVQIEYERCLWKIDDTYHQYTVRAGNVEGSASVFPGARSDRIFLANASGLPEFRSLHQFLTGLEIEIPLMPGFHTILARLNRMARGFDHVAETRSIATDFRDFAREQPDRFNIVQDYLRAIAPPFYQIRIFEAQEEWWLVFDERDKQGSTRSFHVSQSSAGLVHAAEILLAVFRTGPGTAAPAPVLIEEPEALLHPGAVQILRDAFIEASKTRQILVTTHSPDLLDDDSVDPDWIRMVSKDGDGTHVAKLDAGTESLLRDRLATPGRLFREGALEYQP